LTSEPLASLEQEFGALYFSRMAAIRNADKRLPYHLHITTNNTILLLYFFTHFAAVGKLKRNNSSSGGAFPSPNKKQKTMHTHVNRGQEMCYN